MTGLRSWDIFCRVVDNFGDIGVCWRLARGLASDPGRRVRLWVDSPAAFLKLNPDLTLASLAQPIRGVEVRHWTETLTGEAAADVVVEAFACELPDDYLAAMVARRPAPVWINLEYLSAEAWVGEWHRLSSPHPRLRLTKYFWFPGFDVGTGGLLREPGLIEARCAFCADPGAKRAFLAELGVEMATPEVRMVSLFAYPNPALRELVTAWSGGSQRVLLLVPEGHSLIGVGEALGGAFRVGERRRFGALEVQALPFMDQDRYDRLLWACDLNFVRGEDSFVRAQWAGQPFVWHIYRQPDDAHVLKLEAFLQRFTHALEPAVAARVQCLWRAWNGVAVGVIDWRELLTLLPLLRDHARAWSAVLGERIDLATNLADFCESGL